MANQQQFHVTWQKMKDGHIDALEQLYRANFQKFYDYGMRMTQDASMVEDVIQEVFLRLWEKRQRLAHPNHVVGYLMQVFRNLLIDHIRSGERQSDLLLDYPHLRPPWIAPHENTIIREERKRNRDKELHRLLEDLPGRQREIVYLLHYKEMSYDQVSKLLNIKKRTVYNLAFRALRNMRQKIRFQIH